jgi:ferric-dicitrate binding protein FerR (iron transport regulator)
MDISKYKSYAAIDLMMDEDFIRYALWPDTGDILFWNRVKEEIPGMGEKMEEARLALLSIQSKYHAVDSQQIERTWNAIAEKTENQEKRRQGISFRKMKYAAVICSLAFVCYFLFFGSPKQYVYITSYGQSAKVILPDSSEVLLNANSRVIVTERTFFAGLKMKLDGEAYFNIRNHNVGWRSKKCSVETNQARIIVTGTEFNVRSRGSKTQVYLDEGGVYITDLAENTSMKLSPGELAEVDETSRSFLKTRTGSEKFTSWKKGYLSFQQTTLAEVFALLQDQYGIKANILSPDILNKTFSGQIPGNNPELLIKAVEESFGLAIERKKNQEIYVRKKTIRK